MDLYQGVYVGVRNIVMELSSPVPSWCNVFYLGQVPTCFSFRETGHTRTNSPRGLVPPLTREPTGTSAPSTLPVVTPPTTTVATTESSSGGPTVLPPYPQQNLPMLLLFALVSHPIHPSLVLILVWQISTLQPFILLLPRRLLILRLPFLQR